MIIIEINSIIKIIVQTIYDIVKPHEGDSREKTLPAGWAGKEGEGLPVLALTPAGERANNKFIINLSVNI